MRKNLSKPLATAVLVIGALGLVACGESSEEKATKQVCAAVKEINTQITRLQSLPISSTFPAEARTSVEAITKSVGEIKSAAPKLEAARVQEAEAATRSFQAEFAAYAGSIASAAKSSSLEAALKSAEPRIKASLSKLAGEYKKVYESLKCS